jgi:diguanylate cyclase (GGDEF)-like protein
MTETSEMTVSDSVQSAPPVPTRGRASLNCVPTWLVVLTATVACVGLIWLLYPPAAAAGSTLELGYRAALTMGGLLVLVTIAATSWKALHAERVAGTELRRMLEILPRVRSGELPIDELKAIDGFLGALSLEVQEMLHEIRQQRSAIAAIEAELPQRVASRTSALERTIGSLRQQAIRDPMTGLYNRRLLDQHLPPIVERCRLSKAHLSLLMIDVDHFKVLNDTLGHAAGDELLRDIAQIIRSTIRENDVAFRYGGDEFIVVLEGFDAEAGAALGDRLISLVDALAQTLRVEPKPRLSIGVATIKDLAKATPTSLVQEADRLLYEEKRNRKQRNAVVAATSTRIAV